MNLAALQLECYRRLNFTATPAATVVTRLTAYLNEAHRRLLTSPGLEQLRDDATTFASIASQVRYALPPNVARVKALTDVTNQRRLRPLRRGDYRRYDPGVTASGIPDWYIPLSQQSVALQPLTATGLWAVSTSAADITTLKVYVETFLTGGYVHVPAAAGTVLTGLTRVQLGARTDIVNVAQFYLSAACAGFVSLYTAVSGGVELARIEPGKTASRWLVLELSPTPTTAITYTVDYTRTISDMSDPTDEPYLPEDFHYLLPMMACRREYVFADDKARYLQMAAEEQEGLRALRAWVLYPPDYRVRNSDPAMAIDGGSNLGSFFPAGRW